MITSPFLSVLVTLICAYVIGSIPSGWVIVKLATGRDLRTIESGRTGGTNTMRAAGFLAGLTTAILDIAKGFVMLWVVGWLVPADLPGRVWLQVAAPLLVIIGHNYSIFMIERDSQGRLRLRGGAGGAPCLGGAMSLWPWMILIVVPIGLINFFIVGYASVTTLGIAVTSILVFIYLAIAQGSPWAYVVYGLISLGLLAWALRPNIARLIHGTERLVGIRAYLRKRKAAKSS